MELINVTSLNMYSSDIVRIDLVKRKHIPLKCILDSWQPISIIWLNVIEWEILSLQIDTAYFLMLISADNVYTKAQISLVDFNGLIFKIH